MESAFRIGARGIIVRDLQNALGGIAADGIFGARTMRAVQELQQRHGRPADGCAGCAEFEAAGLAWPDEFIRCLNLTSSFEGTDYGECNKRDIDGAGFTFSVIGFTTGSGEVQRVIAEFVTRVPASLGALDPSGAGRLEQLASARHSPAKWNDFFYDDGGIVREDIARALREWGAHTVMRDIQTGIARAEFWEPAMRCAGRLGFSGMAARGFFFDVHVQNGGWRPDHERVYNSVLSDMNTSEERRLEAAARAVAARAAARWRSDVLARKLVFARGAGSVHGVRYRLAAQGFGL